MAAFRLGLILSCLAVFGHCAEIVNPPQHTVVQKGQDARINCTVEGDLDQGSPLLWKEHISNPAGAVIYNTDMDGPNDPDDYEIVDSYDLVIKDTDLMDGGYYSCALGFGAANIVSLVVLDSPVPISNPIDYYAGGEYNLGCSLQYGSPIAEQAEERLPVIRASVGNRVVAVENATIDRQNGDPGVEASSYSLSFKYLALAEDDGEEFNCDAVTDVPEYQLRSGAALSIMHSVSSVNVPNLAKKYRVGDKITCMANGNPEPTYAWSNVNEPESNTIASNVLKIRSNMEGRNEWRCSAVNEVDGESTEVETTVEFEVVGDMFNGAPTATAALLTTFLAFIISKFL